jgi:8-oxo-dGTP pyrophosphatase MutT (NUDIX family)
MQQVVTQLFEFGSSPLYAGVGAWYRLKGLMTMFERIRQALTLPGSMGPGLMNELGITATLNPAAVLVPLFLKDDEIYFVMTHRTDQVNAHKNQISFPGGGMEPRDTDLVATALRESHEEIGLMPGDVEILGQMEDTFTITGYRIRPVVGHIPFPYDFKSNPFEVRELLFVPWTLFSEGQHHRREQMQIADRTFDVDYYQFGQHTIWGVTARIARQLVEATGAITGNCEAEQ